MKLNSACIFVEPPSLELAYRVVLQCLNISGGSESHSGGIRTTTTTQKERSNSEREGLHSFGGPNRGEGSERGSAEWRSSAHAFSKSQTSSKYGPFDQEIPLVSSQI